MKIQVNKLNDNIFERDEALSVLKEHLLSLRKDAFEFEMLIPNIKATKHPSKRNMGDLADLYCDLHQNMKLIDQLLFVIFQDVKISNLS